ncbi:MAG: hypothetical protein ACYC7F_06390 [Gemmatimonadaceae bacterium]
MSESTLGAPTPMRLIVTYPTNLADLPPHEPANYFHLAQLGYDIVISIGVVDPLEAGLRQKANEAAEPRITRRLMMSVGSLRVLHRQVSDMMKKSGLEPLGTEEMGDVA